MKILIITQRFYPDNFRITDIATELVNRGHSVTVIAGLPLVKYDEYKKNIKNKEVLNGFEVIRVKEAPKKSDILGRLLNYYSFPFLAKKKLRKIKFDYDVILMNELSPIMSSRPAIYAKKKYGVNIVMYEMDLWPESLLAGNIKKGSFVYNHFKKVSGKIYSKYNKILVSTEEHKTYIHNLPKCSNVEIDYLPQYAEDIFIKDKIDSIKDSSTIDLLFAGNIGIAQSCETIIEAARLVQDSNLMFHIVGNGTEKDKIGQMVKDYNLKNVKMYDSRPMTEMPLLYSKMDGLIVTLKNSPYACMTLPGKVQSYLASGKPIISAANGVTNNLVDQYGLGVSSESDNPEAFAKACLKFSSMSKEQRKEMSENCYHLYENQFSKELFFNKLISELEKYAKK